MNLEVVQAEIINCLIFQESFETLTNELKSHSPHIVADGLKGLIHKGLVITFREDDNGNWVRGRFYNSDNMNDFQYGLTALGVKALEELQKINL